MKRLALALAFLLPACDGGSPTGGNPTPTPEPALNLGGTWTGTLRLTGAEGTSCLAADNDALFSSGSTFYAATLDLAHSGDAVSGVLRYATVDSSIAGNLSAGVVSLAIGEDAFCNDIRCSGGRAVRFCRNGVSASGTATATSLTLAYRETKSVSDGTLVWIGTLTLAR